MRTGFLLIALLSACGTLETPGDTSDATPGTPDANLGAPDAEPGAPDAEPGVPDATPIPTTSVLFQNGKDRAAGAVALLYAPDGALVKDTTANADGEVSFENVAPGSSITLGTGTVFGPSVVTVLDVQPGDRIAVGNFEDPTITEMQLTVPGLANVTRFSIGSGCFRTQSQNVTVGSGATITVRALASCKKADGWTIVAVAQDSANKPLFFAKAQHSGAGTVNIPATSWTPVTDTSGYSDLTVTYSNSPANQMNAQLTLLFPFPTGLTTAIGGFTDLTRSFRFRYPPGIVDKLRWSVESRQDNESSIVVFRTLTPALTSAINVGAEGLPIPATLTHDFSNTARPKLTWSRPADGADMVSIRTRYTGTGGPIYSWQVYAPPGTSTVQLPVIPSTHGEMLPPAPSSSVIVSSDVTLVDTVASDWNATRQDPVRLEVVRQSNRGKTLR